MKKIYMILSAVFALLSLSLNAQLLPEFQKLKANPTQFTELRNGQHIDVSSSTTSHQGKSMRAPLKALNEGEYYVGPYTTDEFNSSGLGFGDQYNQDQSILVGVILDRSEFENHLGDNIVGFRFALAGTGQLPVFEFAMIPYHDDASSLYFDQDNLKEWGMEAWNQPTTTTRTVTFNQASDYGSTSVTKDGVTISTTSGDLAQSYNQYRFYANSTTTISTTSGTITRIEFTGVRNYPVSRWSASTGTLSTSDYNGTWTGDASSINFTCTQQIRCTQIVVTVTETTTPTYQILDCGQWHEYRLNEPVEFNVASDVTKLFIAYNYYQEVSGGTNFELYPMAYNSNSTGHDHMALMYADASSTSTPDYQRSWWLWNFPGDLAVQLIFEESAPKLITPANGSTINVGSSEGGASVSTTITVSGQNLTEDLTVSVSGTGFTVTPTTLTAADVNDGTATITVTYNGDPNATTGTLTIGSSEASTTVNLTATYIDTTPVLNAPVDGTTVDVGTNNGMGVSKTIAVSGTYLTEDLTVSVSGAGFTVSPTTLSADAVNNGTATVTVTYNGTTTATGTLTISSGEVTTTVNLTGTYSTGIAPTAHGMVRMGTLRIVDQFAEKIPATNDHPYRYTYFLKLATRDTTSSPARVPVQHTGAEMNGYYTHAEMKGDTDPANFLTEDMLSAEVDMTLSPSSAPYFYTINSVKNGVPASVTDYNNHYKSYLNVLQRREAGDYQEMQAKYNDEITNPHKGDIYAAGAHDFFDYRAIQAETKDDSLSYVPIVWTKGIDRHYYVEDSLHNSYGAPIWEVRTGDVMIDQSGTVCQRQVAANGGWNSTVNYTVDGTDYSLYLVSVNAKGILPESNIDYEPYMFRLWLYDDNASLRNYTWMENDNWTKIEDAGAYTENGGKWKLLDTKMCENWGVDIDGNPVYHADTTYVVTINPGTSANPQSWQNNIGFVAPISGFTPTLYVRFYYKIKGAPDPTINGLRGDGDGDNVGYVVLRGVNPDPGTGVYEIVVNGEVESQIYYNVQGMQSDKPFEGINIVVTRYSNGATTTTKVRH